MKPLKNQIGGALIAALLLIAIIAGFATLMLRKSAQLIQIQTQIQTQSHLQQIAQSGVIWAKQQIQQDWQQFLKNKTLPQKFPQTVQLKTQSGDFAGYQINISIAPLQTRFNLNSIKNQTQFSSFKRLLKSLFPNQNKQQREALANNLLAWFTPNNSSNGNYLKQHPPYLASNLPLSNLDELNLIQGFSPDIINKLRPYVTTLSPNITSIDVNYSSPLILSLIPNLDYSHAVALHQCALSINHIQTDKALQECIKQAGVTTSSSQFTRLSQYFLVNIQIKKRHQIFRNRLIIHLIQYNDNSKDHKLILNPVIINAHYHHVFLQHVESQT